MQFYERERIIDVAISISLPHKIKNDRPFAPLCPICGSCFRHASPRSSCTIAPSPAATLPTYSQKRQGK